jgi:type III secretion system low calcium response chaperone LcrH/SycD
MGPELDEATLAALTDRVAKLLESGATLSDVLGYSKETLESLYALGHRFYKQGRYAESMKVFGFLVIHDHLERRFLHAFASSLQMMRNYESAIRYYTLAASLDLTDPTPLLHVSECLIAQSRTADARDVLDLVMDQSSATEHAATWQRATALLSLLDSADSSNERKTS